MPENMFAKDEQDALYIFKRQNELDQWHKIASLQDQIDIIFQTKHVVTKSVEVPKSIGEK